MQTNLWGQHRNAMICFLRNAIYTFAGSPLGVFEQDPLTKQTVLNTVAKGGTSLMTPMPGALKNSNNMVATVLNRKKGELVLPCMTVCAAH